MNNMIITVIAEMDIIGDTFVFDGTEFVFFKKHDNAMDYTFDEYFNSDEWVVDDVKQTETDKQTVFMFQNAEFERNFRMLIIEEVDMDDEEMKLVGDVITFED